MNSIFSSYAEARKYLFGDRVNLILAMFPVTVGVILYVFLGGWLFQTVIPSGSAWVTSYFSSDTVGNIFYYILVTLVSIIVYLLVSWTMVLVISLIASPFNDLISSRVEKLMKGEATEDLSKGMTGLIIKLAKTLINEIKKVLMILFFTVLALLLNLLPILAPLALMITAILLAIQFVDYSWSRHELASRECFRDARRNWIPYALTGAGFLAISTIPIVNLFLPSYATSYYTVLWSKLRENLISNSKN